MSGIQPTRDRPAMGAPNALIDDGVTIITGNQDESYALDRAWENAPIRTGDLSREDDSCVNPAFADGDIGGS
jgi:hypothetical protein